MGLAIQEGNELRVYSHQRNLRGYPRGTDKVPLTGMGTVVSELSTGIG